MNEEEVHGFIRGNYGDYIESLDKELENALSTRIATFERQLRQARKFIQQIELEARKRLPYDQAEL